MMMAMKRFMLGECIDGFRGRLLFNISDHKHCTRILQCRCLVFGSFAVLSSLSTWWSDSAQGLQPPYAMYVASKLGHLLWFPIRGPSHTSSGWLSVGLCSISTVNWFSACQMKARCTVLLRYSGIWHAPHSSAVT